MSLDRNAPGGQRTKKRRASVMRMQQDVSRLRRAYFARGADAAVRYSVPFDRVETHVEDAARVGVTVPMKRVRYVDDLLHAIACIDNAPLAWSDLVDQQERMLIRACRQRLEETEAILHARRLFVQLRRGTASSAAAEDAGRPSLRRYLGDLSLRSWLCRRLVEQIEKSNRIAIDELRAPVMRHPGCASLTGP